jgi:hypothetical protein
MRFVFLRSDRRAVRSLSAFRMRECPGTESVPSSGLEVVDGWMDR